MIRGDMQLFSCLSMEGIGTGGVVRAVFLLASASVTSTRARASIHSIDKQVFTCISFSMPDVFEALAAPARQAILDALHERDGQTLFELCTRLTMNHGLSLTRQAISQHLGVLESAGLISTEREGRFKYHYLDTTPLRAMQDRWLTPRPKGS